MRTVSYLVRPGLPVGVGKVSCENGRDEHLRPVADSWAAGAMLDEADEMGTRLEDPVIIADVALHRGPRALGNAFEAERRWSGRLSIKEALAYALEEEDLTGERPSPLTRRETEVARLVGQGMSNKEIAAQLVISQRTAEGHVEHILTKLGFASRIQIAVWVNDRARPDDRHWPARMARADPGGPHGIGRGE